MGAVKLQWEQKYYGSCSVLSASHLLTSNTWVIVRTKGMELYTYWSAAYKFHKLNKVLCILHFFSDWSSSKGLCFKFNSIIKALFNHTVLFRNVYPHSGFACIHASPLFLNLGMTSKGTSGNLSISYLGLYQPASPCINPISAHFKEMLFTYFPP